ncbi:putative transposase IS4/IS5 family [Actinobacteria bacterium OV450]|nr:putative transposase IS4/IS5 family [Actinobacteria bacterium OV450]
MTRAQLTDQEWQFIEPYLPIGRFGPYPVRLREQFEGVIWRFRTGSQWREMPERFGAWQTVYQRFLKWRDTGVFQALLEEAIASAAARGEVDLSLVSVDSTVARAHQDAAGMRLDGEVLAALEEAVLEQETARQKGDHSRDRTDIKTAAVPSGPSADGPGDGEKPA